MLAPKSLGDLLAGHQPTAPFDQQNEQLHGEFFQTQEAVAPLKSVLGLVEFEIAELKFLGRKSSHTGPAVRGCHDPPCSAQKQLRK